MSEYTPTTDEVRETWAAWSQHGRDNEVHTFEEWADVRRGDFDRWLRQVKAAAIREYVAAARENPHTYHWPPVGVLDDAEQWADEIEKGAI